MKSNIYAFAALTFGLLTCIIFLGNSGGAARSGNYFTGAPTAAGGMEGTCSTCHNGGGFGDPSVEVLFADESSTDFAALTSYEPGKTYSVQVAVGYTNEPAGYGFQAQILTEGANPATAGTLDALDDGVVNISNGRGDRRYAEHGRISNDSTFRFTWTAPEADMGAVNIYAVGNLVNRAQGTGGDNGSTAPTIIQLEEGELTSTRVLTVVEGSLYPNPAIAGTLPRLELDLQTSGTYTLRITDLSGRVLEAARLDLRAGQNNLPVSRQALRPGLYLVSLVGEGGRFARRLIVR